MKKLLIGLLIFGSAFTTTYTYLDITGGNENNEQNISRRMERTRETTQNISVSNGENKTENIATIAGQQLILPEGTTISCGDITKTRIGYRSDTAVLETSSGTWRGELTIHGDGWVFTQYNKIIEQGVVL